jgi:hypothetical protein
MSSQGVMSGKKTSYHPGLSPVKGDGCVSLLHQETPEVPLYTRMPFPKLYTAVTAKSVRHSMAYGCVRLFLPTALPLVLQHCMLLHARLPACANTVKGCIVNRLKTYAFT